MVRKNEKIKFYAYLHFNYNIKMKTLISIFKNMGGRELPMPILGRWNISYCHKEISQKVNYANEDNCFYNSEYNNKNKKIVLKNIDKYGFMNHYKIINCVKLY